MNNTKKVNQVLAFKTMSGLTFGELFETGRLGLEPKDNVDEVIRRLWPADTLAGHKENRKLREEVIAHLYK